MKKITLSVMLSLWTILLFPQELENLYVEQTRIHDSVGFTEETYVYRFFVDLAPNCLFNNAFGDQDNPLYVKTTTKFYNNFFGTGLGDNINSAIFSIDDKLYYDSWISVGAVSQQYIGVPFSQNAMGLINALPSLTSISLNINLDPIDSETVDSVFMVIDGTWGGPQETGVNYPETSSENMVLIGQFTTTGIIKYNLNCEIINASGEPVRYVSNATPSTGLTYAPVLRGVTGPGIIPPTVNIVTPENNTSVFKGDSVTIEVNAADEDSVLYVELLINNLRVKKLTEPPYIYKHKVTGNVTLTAVAFDSNSASSISEPVFVNGINTNVRNISADTQLKLYPNPVYDQLNVQLLNSPIQDDNYHYTIYDLLGNVIENNILQRDNNIPYVRLNVSGYQEGAYIIQIQNADFNIVKQFMKLKTR